MKIVSSIVLFFVTMFTLTACVPATSGYDSNSNSNSNSGSYRPVSKDFVIDEKWFLTELNNAPYQGPRITLEISKGNRVSGFSGCNRYFGSVDVLRNNQLRFESVASTRKLCIDRESNLLEKKYLGILREVTNFNKSNSHLKLYGSYGNLTFYKKSVR